MLCFLLLLLFLTECVFSIGREGCLISWGCSSIKSKSEIWIWRKQEPVFTSIFFAFDKTLNPGNEVWSVATHAGVDTASGKPRVGSSHEAKARSAMGYFSLCPWVMFILAVDDVTAVFPPQYSSSNIASLTAQLKMHENDYFICVCEECLLGFQLWPPGSCQ